MCHLEAVRGRHHLALPQDHIQQFHDGLNLTEPTIQFTIETEVDGTLVSGHQDHMAY